MHDLNKTMNNRQSKLDMDRYSFEGRRDLMEHDIFPRVHYKDPDKYVYGDMPLCLYLYIYINYLYYVQT
jgi:hypothetical protein